MPSADLERVAADAQLHLPERARRIDRLAAQLQHAFAEQGDVEGLWISPAEPIADAA